MIFIFIIIGMVVFLFLLYNATILYTEKVVSFVVDRKHQDAESILGSGYAPPEWGKRGIMRWANGPVAKLLAMRRLNAIIKYFKHTLLVKDEDSRKLLIGRLESVKESWQPLVWREIYLYKS